MSIFRSFKTLLVVATTISYGFLMAQTTKPDYKLEDVWRRYSFYPMSVQGIRSMNDGLNYTVLEDNKVVQYEYATGNPVKVLFDFAKLKGVESFNIDEYQFNSSETQILLETESTPIYRHSYTAKYYLYDIKKNTIKSLSDAGAQQLMSFSPDGNKLAFVRDNNLYIYDLSNNSELAISTDGVKNRVINGAPDWVYEEEFSFSKAFEWSPDGQALAYIKFDESNVKEFTMPIYDQLYPSQYTFKYPKAGEENAKVSVHVYQISTKKTTDIKLPVDYEYIPRIQWTKNSNVLSIRTLNRLQNELNLILADVKNSSVDVIYTNKNTTYIEINDHLTFTDDGQYFIYSHEDSGFNHLYLYQMNGKPVRAITSGNWEVIDFKGFDAKSQKLFYISTEESPITRTLYEIKIDGSGKKKLSEKNGVNEVEFSKTFQYYINTWSSAQSPYEVNLYNQKGKNIRTLMDNKAMFEKLQSYRWSAKTFFTFKNSDGIELNGWMIKPADFDANKKYPVFMTVYGGPGQQTVMDEWDYTALWHNLLAQKGYIVVSVDNRGTDGRGYDFKRATYKQMGKLESQDQADAVKYLQSQPFVDAARIGIEGWSYGGYMSTLCLERFPELFKMAIAVAPVTNWRFYDSVYSERYLGLPGTDPQAYDDYSPINKKWTSNMKGKYLLIHGTADDNVHFQNTMQLTEKLVDSNVEFEQFSYPNKNHGIYGGNTRFHLFNKMTKFIEANL